MKSFLSAATLALVLAPEYSMAQLSSAPKRLRTVNPVEIVTSSNVNNYSIEEWGRQLVQEFDNEENQKQQRKMTEEGSMPMSMSMSFSMSVPLVVDSPAVVDKPEVDAAIDDETSPISESAEAPTTPDGKGEEYVAASSPDTVEDEPRDQQIDNSKTVSSSTMKSTTAALVVASVFGAVFTC